MEDWNGDGRMEGWRWKDGRVGLEGWKIGGVEGWKGGRLGVEGLEGGRVEGWKGMEDWMEDWRRVEWKIELIIRYLISPVR